MQLYKNNKEKIVTYVVFAVYLLLLVWLVLFKFAVTVDEIPHLRGINFIPFHYVQENSFHLKEVIYNVIVFIPAGFYFSAIFSNKNVFLGMIASTVMSLVFEILQWVFSIGASDITDFITNTLGGFCGMLLFLGMRKITAKHRMTIINVLGIIIEVTGGLLLFILIIANR